MIERERTFDGFMAAFDPDGTRVIADIAPVRDADGNSPFVVVRHGRFAAVLCLMPFSGGDGHLCIDVHPFADGQDATAAAFGMTTGQQHVLPATGTTSHGWPSAHLIAVLIGEQDEVPFTCSGQAGCRAPDGDDNHAHYCPQHSQEAS